MNESVPESCRSSDGLSIRGLVLSALRWSSNRHTTGRTSVDGKSRRAALSLLAYVTGYLCLLGGVILTGQVAVHRTGVIIGVVSSGTLALLLVTCGMLMHYWSQRDS